MERDVGKIVLVVDDYPDALDLMEALISKEGYEVWKAESAFVGLQILENQRPDAVVLDIMMPGRSGVEMLENIRWDPKLAKIPVVCVSAANVSGEALEFIKEFSLGLIDKANIRELVVELKKVLPDS